MTKTDFYKLPSGIYYVTMDPVDKHYVYFIEITGHQSELAYENMVRGKWDDDDHKYFSKMAVPYNIGWVPVNCDIKKDYPELLI